MHIQKIDAGDGFYATAWCGEQIGMLDGCYMTVDNAIKAIEEDVGNPCRQCLTNVITIAAQGLPSLPIHSGSSLTCEHPFCVAEREQAKKGN